MSFKKIFFSYSRIDGSAFALKLALDLKKRGFEVWIDQQDIRAGSEWDLEIEKALETCDCLLFLESEKSVSSNNVLDEVYYALEQKKKVIPVIIHDSKTPYRLQRLQHIDFSADYDKGLASLVNSLQAGDYKMPEPQQDNASEKTPGSLFTKKLMLLIAAALFLIVLTLAFLYLPRNKNSTTVPDKQEAMLPENFSGVWALIAVEPAATIGKGYLKIDALASKKTNISSSFQFYYVKNNDTLFLNVFNGFASCTECKLQQEMKLVTDDIAVASQKYSISKTEREGKEALIDTVANQGSNQSIKATITLQFTDDKNAVIKVQSSKAVLLTSGVQLEPFTYSFRFKKTE